MCDIENPASGRVMEKAGLSLEGTFKRYDIHPNMGDEPRDVHSYAKTR
ncbi:MAG: GNAT family protein [Opitutales bacterium]|nr:GNAT family protein [Opitutales bacterium]